MHPPARVRSSGCKTAPLSFGQQRLWFLEQLDPGTPAYHVSLAYGIDGPLDVEFLRQSLTGVIARHDALRTRIDVVDQEPVQVVAETPEADLRVVDLTAYSEGAREAEAVRQGARAALEPFDLQRGPLFRALLYSLGADAYVLVFITHHIISDGWSMKVMFDDLSKIYGMLTGGQRAELPPPRLQYSDFAEQQTGSYDRRAALADIDFWKRTLDGVADLNLPIDVVEDDIPRYKGTSLLATVSRDQKHALRKLGASLYGTLFMVMQAVLALLLHRLTGQNDLVLGSPTAGRDRIDDEETVGLFLNMIPLRTQLSGASTFRELAARVRDTSIGAFAAVS